MPTQSLMKESSSKKLVITQTEFTIDITSGEIVFGAGS